MRKAGNHNNDRADREEYRREHEQRGIRDDD